MRFKQEWNEERCYLLIRRRGILTCKAMYKKAFSYKDEYIEFYARRYIIPTKQV